MDTNDFAKIIGGRLHDLRLRFNLTKEDVATLLSTSLARYVQLENGEASEESEELQADEAVILCNHYGISFDEFMGAQDKFKLDELTPEQIKAFAEILSEFKMESFFKEE